MTSLLYYVKLRPKSILYLRSKNKQIRKKKIIFEGSAGSQVLFGVRVLVASDDVNLKRQMIIPEAEKIMWYYSLRYRYLIRHIFLSSATRQKGVGEEGSQKTTEHPHTKTTTVPLSMNLTN